MMASPLAMVILDMETAFNELEDVKVQQPLPTPRPTTAYEVVTPNAKRKESALEELEDVKDQQPLPTPRPSTADAVVTPNTKRKDLDLESEPTTEEVLAIDDLSKLDYLNDLEHVNEIMCTRRLQVKNLLAMKGTTNTFSIQTPDQKLVYTINEENRWWVGYCLDGLRPLTLKVKNSEGIEVMRMKRPYAFTTRLLPCRLQSMMVYSPPDHPLACIIQRWSAVRPHYIVKDFYGQIIFEIHGPCITISYYQEVAFVITRPDGTLAATIKKRWQGLVHALFLSPVVDRFSLQFTEESLPTEEKAMLLATSLLLDYMYYDM